MSTKDDSSRLISFDGKKKNFPAWKEKFLAKARKKGYKDVLLGKTKVEKDGVEILATDPDKIAKEKAREDNEAAYADLILSIQCESGAGRVVFNLIKNSKSDDYPDGHASTAWASLERKFNPKTTNSRTKLHRLFYKAQLRKGSDPIHFVTYLEDIRGRLKDAGEIMSDSHFVTQVTNCLTAGYDNEVRMIEREVDLGEPCSIEDMKERLSVVYERLNERGSHDDEDYDEPNDGDDKAF